MLQAIWHSQSLVVTESFLISKFKHPHATLTRWLKNAMRLLEKHEVAQVLDEVAQLAILIYGVSH